MNKWIRWWGIIAFVAVILIAAGIWYLLADKIIENNIEKSGEFIVGAEVEIGKADLSVIPLGITLKDVKVTDPNSPMKNLIDVENVQFHIDGKYLFERKVIIQDMVVDGLKFNTDREKSGEIAGAKPLTVKCAFDDFVMPLLDLSKLKTFIEQEELQSIDGLNDVIGDIERVNNEWQVAFRMMPTMDDLTKHRNRANSIKKEIEKNKVTGLIANRTNIKNLKEAIERDVDEININKKAMQIDIDSLKTKKNRAMKYIESDFAKLSAKYTPDIRGLKNFSKFIFKDDILRQIDEGLVWYNKLEPIFNYASEKIKDDYYGSEPFSFDGIDVQFPEFDPKPAFLIELAKLSFEKSLGDFSGEIKNFTVQQNVLGLPTSIKLGGDNLEFANSININGLINHINKDDIKDDFSISIDKQKLNEQNFDILKDWNLSIGSGFVSKDFDVKIHNGKVVGNIGLDFIGTSFASNYSGDNNIIINKIAMVLQNVSNFNVDVNLSGTSGHYATKISSDLDNIIDNAVTEIAIQEANKVKNTISNIIDKKKTALIQKYNSELETLSKEKTRVVDLLNEAKKILRELP